MTLLLSLVLYVGCGIPPIPPIPPLGCTEQVQVCICDQNGNCSYQYICKQ